MSSNILLLKENVTVSEATTHMQKKNCDEIIVIDKLSKPIGIVTDEDILKRIGEQHARPRTTRLDDIMTFPLVTIKHNDTLQHALDLMKQSKLRKLAVLSDYDTVIGMIFREIKGNSSRVKERHHRS